MKHHKLKVANIGVTDIEYKRTILKGLPDILAAHATQTLSTLRLTVKYTSKPIDMSDVINSVCEEADRVKTHRALKDQSLGQGKGKKGAQTDEALTATTFERGNNSNLQIIAKRANATTVEKKDTGYGSAIPRSGRRPQHRVDRLHRPARAASPRTSPWAPQIQ